MINVQDLENRLVQLDGQITGALELLEQHESEVAVLVAKARTLVALLDDAEVNHGGLYSSKTMRGRDDLRLELSRWPK